MSKLAAQAHLTQEQLKKAREMARNMIPNPRIARELNVSYHQIRAALEPGYRAKRAESAARARQRIHAGPAATNVVGFDAGRHAQDAAYDPLRDGPLRLRDDTTAILLGDPPVGRSALDRMRGEAIV